MVSLTKFASSLRRAQGRLVKFDPSNAKFFSKPTSYAAIACSGRQIFLKPMYDERRFFSSSVKFGDEGADGPVTVDYGSVLSEKDFHGVANETLEHLQERIEAFGENIVLDGFDTDFAEGVLTVRFGNLGTYVINKQTPNRQIWLSSPVSGPARFDWVGNKWEYRRTKAELVSLLQKEISTLVGRPIDFS